MRASDASVSKPAGAMKPRSTATHDALAGSVRHRAVVGRLLRAREPPSRLAASFLPSRGPIPRTPPARRGAPARRRGRTSRATDRRSRCGRTNAVGRCRRGRAGPRGPCRRTRARTPPRAPARRSSAHQAAAREHICGGGARLVLLELVAEEVAEQPVIAVGAAMRIERDHEQVVSLQPPQQRQRSGRSEGGVAQRSAHGVQHGRAAQPRPGFASSGSSSSDRM